MKKLAPLVAAAAFAIAITACSSAGSSTPSHVNRTHAAAARAAASASGTGTETIHGIMTGAAGLASDPVIHVTLSGPVGTAGTTTLGGRPEKGQSRTVVTPAGNLVVTLDGSGTDGGGLKSQRSCLAEFTSAVPFTVDGAKSTGRFAGAAGNGTAVVVFSGNLPKLSDGKCDEGQNAEPSPKTVSDTFTATARLMLTNRA